MTVEICEVCGRCIPFQKYSRNKKRTTCSFECRQEARRRRAREYNRTHRIKEHGTVAAKVRHKAGYDELASAIVNTAIEDIRRLSKSQITNYEKPGYRETIQDKYGYYSNYHDSKAFLLSTRVSGLIDMDGTDIFNMLMEEKGLKGVDHEK